MHSAIRLGIVVTVSLLAGGAMGYFTHRYQVSATEKWYEIEQIPLVGSDSGLRFTTEALFESDIGLPTIARASAKVKFRPANDGTDRPTLGYVVVLNIENLKLDKVPEKYKEEKTETVRGSVWTFVPIKEVVYEMQPSFTLKDSDGFDLVEVSGAKHNITSGQSNVLQSVILDTLPPHIIQRTATIVPHLSIDKCVSCRPGE